MIIGNFEIIHDGENATVMRIGENQKSKEKTLTPVAYTRDLLSALISVQRKRDTQALREEDPYGMIELLTKQHEELIAIVKAHLKKHGTKL
jgi:hypothetical protein